MLIASSIYFLHLYFMHKQCIALQVRAMRLPLPSCVTQH